MSTLRLTDLIAASGVRAEYDRAMADVPVSGITSDSRSVKPGMLFVAVPGVKQDGRNFIADAVAKGAVAIVMEGGEWKVEAESSTLHLPPTTIHVDNARLVLAKFAAALYAPQPGHIVAVTGTDGKTSTADFFRQLAEFCGHKAASIGTLGTLGEQREVLAPGMHTTPDPAELHRVLQMLATSGYDYAAMEASSHGLHQYRLDGVQLEAAAFTNLTRDHLDYHGTDEAYFAAKARLFSELLPDGKTAVLNADDRSFVPLLDICKKRGLRVLAYGKQGRELVIKNIVPHPEGQRTELEIFGKAYALDLPQVGAFQVYNMLAAVGLLAALGEDATALSALLPKLQGVPGRMELITKPKGAAAYIDYAHTPAALENALRVLRAHTQKRLIVVFGCGGDRDKGKRSLMGKAAVQLADVAIVTDDNPRSENAAQIRREVLAAAEGAKEIADRKEAIYGAVRMLSSGDVLLVAGKGHEKTQIINGVEHPFDDAEVIREAAL